MIKGSRRFARVFPETNAALAAFSCEFLRAAIVLHARLLKEA
jgi:hypothetical protein